ncbi:MarR family transcriptional regulator [Haloactinopolyspora alba]|uniref:MarR family transcriptional regulator n=2 Tax=Haloactinopolyspora alba TaxID=648780 RepID=A0A2P8DT83_9ACTN|nr:MarR family transcriptional regulator [Haloactinopolyspora alba]
MTDGSAGHRPTERADLAAMIGPLGKALMNDELPILQRHGLSMWAYAVLSTLDRTPLRTQAALAQAIGADKTRIIATLDDLQDRGLIQREPDPEDRRARLLGLTAAGERLRDAAKRDIQRGEDENWLAHLPDDERDTFLRALATLAARARPDRDEP